jgi:hypothetical protein
MVFSPFKVCLLPYATLVAEFNTAMLLPFCSFVASSIVMIFTCSLGVGDSLLEG